MLGDALLAPALKGMSFWKHTRGIVRTARCSFKRYPDFARDHGTFSIAFECVEVPVECVHEVGFISCYILLAVQQCIGMGVAIRVLYHITAR